MQLSSPGRILRLRNLTGVAEALALADLAGRGHRVLALMRTPAAATRMAEQLRCLLDESLVTHVGGWEVLPYDATSPPKAVASARIAAMAKLNLGLPGVYVSSATDALLPCMPPERMSAHALTLAEGDVVDVSRLVSNLSAVGCAHVDRVRAAGEFAHYGGQLDLFPGGLPRPLRLVFDIERLEQIRSFDPATQLSTGRIARFEVLPAREYPLDDEAVVLFRARWREQLGTGRDDVYQGISQGSETEGAEFYLPLFYGGRSSLFDYLDDDDVVWLDQGARARLDSFAELVSERHSIAGLAGHAVLPPGDLFLDQEDFFKELKGHRVVESCDPRTPRSRDMGAYALPPVGVNRDVANPYEALAGVLAARRRNERIVFVHGGQARRRLVEESVAACNVQLQGADGMAGAKPGVFSVDMGVTGGFSCPAQKLMVISEAELHDYVTPPRHLRGPSSGAGAELGELNPGDLVVHRQHGIGRFKGLVTRGSSEGDGEFIQLEFADDVMLYVAVAQCHLISRHSRPEADARVALHRIGSKRWQRTAARAKKAARDTASHLLELYAKRQAATGKERLTIDEDEYARFCTEFPHSETADQTRACAEVLADLCAAAPMDRLVCGDVGFGKTEVAMRAAWVALSNGHQVAMLAPTTLLADQLQRAFGERFANWDTTVLGLSTLLSRQQRGDVLAKLATGEPAVVIGTHALLGKDVRMPNLRLAIIDEEHRFGVRQKERMRQLRADIELLALSATPIPRTLSMALEGLRDISLLTLPPADRLAVRTFVSADGDSVVREALARELARGGQAFYVHHRVSSIELAHERVRDLAPDAKVELAHGQMAHARLEAVMNRFYRGETDVLVCTSIVESGLDVPNANTMIVPRSDMFGLAQLHQLRGRVGRSARQGYAYLLVPKLAGDDRSKASKRLETLAAAAELGAGHYIAARDLEIRGAGEVLGEAQSGAVVDVGIEAFRNMVAAACAALGTHNLAIDCEIDLAGNARLPSNYCRNPVERMRAYRALSAATSFDEIEELRTKFTDRFGPLPLPARLLLDCHRLRLQATPLGLRRIQAAGDELRLSFVENPPCANFVVDLVSSRADCRLNADMSLQVQAEGTHAQRLALAFKLIERLAGEMELASGGV